MKRYIRSDKHRLVVIQVGLIVTIVVAAYLAPGLIGLLIVPIIGIFLVIQKRTVPKPKPDPRPSQPLMTCGIFLFVFVSLYSALVGVCYATTPGPATSEQNAAVVIQFVVAAIILLALIATFTITRQHKRLIQEKPGPKPPNDLE